MIQHLQPLWPLHLPFTSTAKQRVVRSPFRHAYHLSRLPQHANVPKDKRGCRADNYIVGLFEI
jgi:hypothetical protein